MREDGAAGLSGAKEGGYGLGGRKGEREFAAGHNILRGSNVKGKVDDR